MSVKLIAVVLPLGLDTLGVALALGMAGFPSRRRLHLSFLFSGFEAVMPLIGVGSGAPVGNAIGGVAGAQERDRLLSMTQRGVLGALALGILVSLDELAIGFSGSSNASLSERFNANTAALSGALPWDARSALAPAPQSRVAFLRSFAGCRDRHETTSANHPSACRREGNAQFVRLLLGQPRTRLGGQVQRATVATVGPIIAAALLAGCGSSSSSSTTAASTPAQSSSAPAASTPAPSIGTMVVVTTKHNKKLGTILGAGPKQLTVYLFAADKGSASSCSGQCASVWPPVTTAGKPTASGKAAPADLGTITRSDGATQVTYNGHPLYYYAKDVKDGDAGDTYGQGLKSFGADWYVLAPSGKKVDMS